MKTDSLHSDVSVERVPGFGRCRIVPLVLLTLFCLSNSGCSSSSGDDSVPLPVGSDDMISSDIPTVLVQLQSEPGLLAPVPDIVASVVRANSGLQVAYTARSQLDLAPAHLVEEQWIHMQSCLQMIASAPVVLVRSGAVTPFTLVDDVVRNIDSTAISSSTLEKSLIQISLADFDGSMGEPAFHLRSIMGRYLWLSASLPERDYPFHCARR